ncbi:MAG: peptidylprolyl isomerase [Planctomycetia bacterium]|nr:peptidylprolyl isomerase [Planctomycetia bacterium]
MPQVVLQTTKGNIVVELFEDEAPNTVANFIYLAEKGFYNNNDFHTVISGFMAQTGSPQPDGTGTPGYAIPDESTKPGARKHFRGSLSMAHLGTNTAGSQFFITLVPSAHLDGKYTVFGRVIQGMEVVSALERIDVADEYLQTESGLDQPDKIIRTQILKKRNHPYTPQVISTK